MSELTDSQIDAIKTDVDPWLEAIEVDSDYFKIKRHIVDLQSRLAAAEAELAKHKAVTEYYAEGRRGDRRYNRARIAWELECTALGAGYYGNALRVAKDLPEVTSHDRSLLDRYSAGRQSGTDHVALQELALRIDRAARGDE